jgi:hypothetical protein
LIVFVNVLERLFVMEETIKMKYVAPEIVDFRWMEGLGGCYAGSVATAYACAPNGLDANTQCFNNGIEAGYSCLINGGLPSTAP